MKTHTHLTGQERTLAAMALLRWRQISADGFRARVFISNGFLKFNLNDSYKVTVDLHTEKPCSITRSINGRTQFIHL